MQKTLPDLQAPPTATLSTPHPVPTLSLDLPGDPPCLPRESESESEVAQSCPTLCDPMTIACQAPLSMGFSRQAYWSGLPFLSLGDLPGSGIEPAAPVLAGKFLTTEVPGKPPSQQRVVSKS